MKFLTIIGISVLLALFLGVDRSYGQRTAKQISAKGVEYAAQGKLKEAKEEFEKALKVDPFSRVPKEGLKVIEDAVDQKINNKAAFHFFKGMVYIQEGRLDEAIPEYTKAIEINPRFAEAYIARGVVYKEKGQFDQAIPHYNKAIEINPNYTEAYLTRASTYLSAGEYDRAISDYNKAIEIGPKEAIVYNNRGIAYDSKGEYDRAISDYNKAIKINPECVQAYYNRGVAYVGKGEYDRAIRDYSKAIEINPEHANSYSNRGFVHMVKLGNTRNACSDWKRACELGNCRQYAIAKRNGDCP